MTDKELTEAAERICKEDGVSFGQALRRIYSDLGRDRIRRYNNEQIAKEVPSEAPKNISEEALMMEVYDLAEKRSEEKKITLGQAFKEIVKERNSGKKLDERNAAIFHSNQTQTKLVRY